MSHYIFAVLDDRKEIVNEVRQLGLGLALTEEVAERFRSLLREKRFNSAVSGHMPTDKTSQSRVSIILKK
jgi:hypothetical protein